MAEASCVGDEHDESGGLLVFQRGKQLNNEYYIISVRDNAENATIKFLAFDLETSETSELSFSYADFDTLFKSHPELVNAVNKQGRYDWVVDRLDFIADSNGSTKRLTLANRPTAEDEGSEAKVGLAPKAIPKDRLTYSERIRLKAEADKLEEKRAANIALKSEKNRKAFVAELQEKRKLEELKVAARRQRIEDERSERREAAEMQKRMSEEKQRRYEESQKKREERIARLETERKSRDLGSVHEIIDAANQKKEALQKRLEEARQRKCEEEAEQSREIASKKEAEDTLNAKREQKIAERNERLKHAEREYLDQRKKQIEQVAEEKHQKEEKKQQYLREKAAQRAAQLKAKHDKIEAWETLDDQRTQSNLKKEHARNMLMLDHIESLRQKYSQEQAEAAARRQASLEEQQQKAAKEAHQLAEENRVKAELEQRRNANITAREALRQQKNQEYCEHIRDLKTAEALRLRDQQATVAAARAQRFEEHVTARQVRAEQEIVTATINAQREEKIKNRERDRDLKFAQQVMETKEQENQRKLECDSHKIQKRLHEKEAATRRQEEEQQRRRQMAILDEQREVMIRERALERNRREQERLKGSNDNGRSSPASPAAVDQQSSIPPHIESSTHVDQPR